MSRRDIDIFINGRDHSREAFGSVERSLAGLRRMALVVGSAIGAYLSVRAIGGMISKSIEMVDSLDDAAQAIGTTAEALGALRYAASFAGVESAQLDTALSRMIRTIGEADKGSETSAEAIRRLGLNITKLRTMGADRQFLVIGEAISRITDNNQKVRATFDIFGRGGLQLNAVWADGRVQLEKYMAEARAAGMAPGPETVAKMVAAANASLALKSAMLGLSVTIITQLAPTIERMAIKLNSLISIISRIPGMGGASRPSPPRDAAVMRKHLMGDLVGPWSRRTGVVQVLREIAAGPSLAMDWMRGRNTTRKRLMDLEARDLNRMMQRPEIESMVRGLQAATVGVQAKETTRWGSIMAKNVRAAAAAAAARTPGMSQDLIDAMEGFREIVKPGLPGLTESRFRFGLTERGGTAPPLVSIERSAKSTDATIKQLDKKVEDVIRMLSEVFRNGQPIVLGGVLSRF